jgi:hypothetical protein
MRSAPAKRAQARGSLDARAELFSTACATQSQSCGERTLGAAKSLDAALACGLRDCRLGGSSRAAASRVLTAAEIREPPTWARTHVVVVEAIRAATRSGLLRAKAGVGGFAHGGSLVDTCRLCRVRADGVPSPRRAAVATEPAGHGVSGSRRACKRRLSAASVLAGAKPSGCLGLANARMAGAQRIACRGP